jgi:hypothetical protein
MRIIDGQQHWSVRRNVDHEPVKPVYDGEAGVLFRRAYAVAEDQSFCRAVHSPEVRRSLGAGLGAATFEELAHDPEGEAAFEIGAAPAQNQATVALPCTASGVEDRRLSYTGTAFDDEDTSAAGERPHRRQFRNALKEPGHAGNGYLQEGE